MTNKRDFGANAEPQRYPDPDVVVIAPKRFKAKVGNTAIKRLYTGCLWAEGPAWNAQGQYLVWSDIPANRQLRYLDDDGHISEQFHKPSNEGNGNTFDFQGRQITCERTRLVRYEHNGSITVLAEQAGGKPLNSPNDVGVQPRLQEDLHLRQRDHPLSAGQKRRLAIRPQRHQAFEPASPHRHGARRQ